MADTPLEPLNHEVYGRVIDLAGVRLQRGQSPRKAKICEHKSLTFNETERRVWCNDCKRTIDNFDAFMTFTRGLERMLNEARSMHAKASEALRATARLRATKELDRAWSRNVMAVCCPHCGGGILPEDVAGGGLAQMSRELELARRKKKLEKKQ